MALAGAPLTPDSQYITLMSTASIDSFPNNTSSNFTTRFDPPLELRGGNFNVALMDIFFPTKWINITQDKYFIDFDKKEKIRNHDPRHGLQSDEPDKSSSWTAWWNMTAEEKDEAWRERERQKEERRQYWRDVNERVQREEAERKKLEEEARQREIARQREEEEEEERRRKEEEKRQREIEIRKEAERLRQLEREKRQRATREKEERQRQEEEEKRREEEKREGEEEISPPPELDNIPWRTVAHQKLRIPPAYYPSIESVLENINEHTKDIYKNEEGDMFSLDPNKGKIRLRIKVGVNIHLSRQLAELMGFKKIHHKGGVSKLADYSPNLKKHLGSLHVYINVMKDRVVGDTMAPLIGMVPHVDTFPQGLKIAHHTFLRPYYFPVKLNYMDTVRVNIRSDDGNLVPFSGGSTTLTLHLKRASP